MDPIWIQELYEKCSTSTWTVAILILVAIYIFYKYATQGFHVFKKLGIRGPRPWPVVGTMLPFARKGAQYYLDMKREYGPVVGTFLGHRPMLTIYDPEIIKAVVVKHFNNFQNRYTPNIQDYPIRKMLTMLKDDHWKRVRDTLTPAFTSGKLRKMEHQMEKCADSLLASLQRMENSKQIFDFTDLSGAFAMDVIASTTFNVQIDAHTDPNNVFIRMSKRLFQISFRMVIVVLLPFLLKPLSKIGFRAYPPSVIDFFAQLVDRAVKQRRSGTDAQTNADFLQLMIAAAKKNEEEAKGADAARIEGYISASDNRHGLTHEEILAQGMLFLVAGYETTKSALAYLGYLLAVNDDCQDKLVAEIDEVMSAETSVTYDVLKRMPYLEMCVSEALRMYPPAPATDRVAAEDITINDVRIPKGMIIWIPIYAMHNDPDYWAEPQKFNPDRFSQEAKETRNPYCFLPFGIGPRSCIGMRLALMEVKIAVVHILQRFRFVVSEETQIPLKMELNMLGSKGIRLRVKARANTGP